MQDLTESFPNRDPVGGPDNSISQASVLSYDALMEVCDRLPCAFAILEPDARASFANAAFRTLFNVSGHQGTGSPDLSRVASGAVRSLKSLDGRILPVNPITFGGGRTLVLVDEKSTQAAVEMTERRDALTGLANRVVLKEQIAASLVDPIPEPDGGVETALLLLDLDRFKAVNDTLGHAIGDKLLCRVVDRLRATVRKTDLVARLGGDEFAILQRSPKQPDAAKALAQRLVDLVGRTYLVDDHILNIGVSVGIALPPTDGADPDRLLKSADLALYRAKEEGRGRFRFFEPEMDARAQARRTLELDLRRAFALRQFEVFYQAQMNLHDKQVVGFEALVRWRHPQRGMVSPAAFIPVAEEIGLISQIGEWVLLTACREAANWPGNQRIAVNLSPMQFSTPGLVDTVAAALATSGLPAERLELEITESVLLEDTAATLAILHQLRSLGIRIAMDDFGTGYSSLGYLRSFPFDKVKIDQSFIRDMPTDGDSAAIVKAIIGLGISLGISTTAEGVETEEQLNRLRAEGCTDIQGYLLSKPVPAAEVEAVLNRSINP
jgi:diguanylate cyclase (GGDEF)-like protein